MKYLLVILLLLSPDGSVKTSYWLTKDFHYSVYMNKLFGLAFSDFIIIFLLTNIFLQALYKPSTGFILKLGFFKLLMPLVVFMILSGIIYNLTVDWYLKPLLYDFKWVMYLLAGAILPYTLNRYNPIMRLGWVLTLLFICSLADILYVQILDCCHGFPSIFGFPPLVEVLPLFSMILGASAFSPLIYLPILLMAFFHLANVLALNQIYLSLVAFLIIALKWIRAPRQIPVLLFNICFLFVPIVLILYGNFLLTYKPDGVTTRAIQLANLAQNLSEKGYGVFGMGYGATYREYHLTPQNDIYAVGNSIDSAEGASMAAPVKFIFNTPAAGAIYKYGSLGLVWLFFIMLNIQKKYNLNGWRLGLFYLLYLSILFPGFLKITFVVGYLISLEDIKRKKRLPVYN